MPERPFPQNRIGAAHPLEVLLIESAPGAGAAEAAALRSAGHRVHSCQPAGEYATSALSGDSLPVCVAVTDGSCPIDDGVDVALLCRHTNAGRPRLTEAGVLCALRQDIPLVVDIDGCADGFGPWATGFVHGGIAGPDVVRACEEAADNGFDELRADIARRIEMMLLAANVAPSAVTCHFATEGMRLVITVVGPEVSRSVQQALGVRVLDAVRAAPRVHGQVNVAFEVAAIA